MADRLNSLLPDNLKNRISRIYVDERSFDDDKTGKTINYKRLVLQVLVKGEIFEIEYKPENKDLAIMSLADVVDKDEFQRDRD